MRFFIIAALAILMPIASKAAVITVTISTVIDGHDRLFISGSTLQWQHIGNFFVNGATTISSTTDGSPVMSGVVWDQYLGQRPKQTPGLSQIYTDLNPSLPAIAQNVILNVISKPLLGAVSVFQQPNAANNYTLGLDFNDDFHSGTFNYQARITFVAPESVPEPGTMFLAGAGLCLAGLYRRKAWRHQ